MPDTAPPDVLLRLDAVPTSVAVARQAVVGAAEAIGLDDRSGDIKIAVTEACTNVVVHAYDPGGDGDRPLEVEVRCGAEGLEVAIRDEGVGMGRASERGGLGVGLSLMAALADRVEIARAADDGGTEVRLRFGPADADGGEA